MKDWRKLRKRDLIHLMESMHSDENIESSVIETRCEQQRMAESSHIKEVCHDCASIAKKLGLDGRIA